MFSRKLKTWYFGIEAVHAFATAYYFSYLFFYFRDHYGFGNTQNLMVCALHGCIYMLAAGFGGKYSQRVGYFKGLKFGFGILIATTLACATFSNVMVHVAGVAAWTFGICFIWPTLEALISEEESRTGLPHMIGIYNLIWAGFAGLAFFMGGALTNLLGANSIFWLSAIIHTGQLMVVMWLERKHHPVHHDIVNDIPPDESMVPHGNETLQIRRVSAKTFLNMAWVANPFAYVAVNTLGPIIPDLANRLQLSTAQAGFFCSVYLFARMATFILLWQWTGWHYRFRWMLTAFILLIVSFGTILLSFNYTAIVIAQITLGFAIGIIYYSSLFYSMDVGEAKGEHGGLHESVIGAGTFGGASFGAAGQWIFSHDSSSTLSVIALLCVGFGILLILWHRGNKRANPHSSS